jgi:hypothetical protein
MKFPFKSGPCKSVLVRPAGLLGLGLTLALILGGCGLFEKEQAAPVCPAVSILADASSVTKFRAGPGRDLIDEISRGEITAVVTGCSYEVDSKTGGRSVVMDLALVIAAERGPANRDRRARFDYFVSVMDPARTVLNKKTFTIQPGLPGNLTRVKIKDAPVSLRIPVPQGRQGTDFRIYVGFQLSRQELEYNQKQRSAGR